MLLSKVLSVALRRVGISDSSSAFNNNARDYFNIGLRDLCERRQWRWLFKNSSFTTTASTRTYSLGSDVMRPLSFRNSTDNFKMEMIDPDVVDRLDPDEDEEGTPQTVFVSGINTTTGYWEVDLYPTPDTTSDTIRYRYFAFIADKTSSDDATDLAATMPAWTQNALIYYISAKYKGELGDFQGEQEDMLAYVDSVRAGIKVDADAEDGDQRHRMWRADEAVPGFAFTVQEGSLS